jgi:ferric-dicitrate binding protein FerR (iron transport regulator)
MREFDEWSSIARYLGKAQQEGEKSDFFEKRKKEDDFDQKVGDCEKIWKLAAKIGRMERQLPAQSHEVFKQQLLSQKALSTPLKTHVNPTPRRPYAYAVAATFTLLIVAGAWFFLHYPDTDQTRSSFATLVTEPARQLYTELPDGTKVWLSHASQLVYPIEFAADERRVTLQGEAYFEVAPGEIPFVVESGQTVTQVMGTVFNLRDYPGAEAAKIALFEGKVAFSTADAAQVVLLENQAGAVLDLARGTISPMDPAQFSTAASWKENKLVFKDQPLAEACQELTRWYGKQVNLRDKHLAALRFTGTFQDKELGEVATQMALVLGIQYELKGNKLVFFE